MTNWDETGKNRLFNICRILLSNVKRNEAYVAEFSWCSVHSLGLTAQNCDFFCLKSMEPTGPLIQIAFLNRKEGRTCLSQSVLHTALLCTKNPSTSRSFHICLDWRFILMKDSPRLTIRPTSLQSTVALRPPMLRD